MPYTTALKLLIGLVAVTHYREIIEILRYPIDLAEDMKIRKEVKKKCYDDQLD